VVLGAIARQRAAEDGAAVPASALTASHDSDRLPCSLSVTRCKAVSLGAVAVDREAAPGLLASSDDDLAESLKLASVCLAAAWEEFLE
jgi:hypothetical protein